MISSFLLFSKTGLWGRFFAILANVSKAERYEIPESEKAVPKVTF